MAFEIYKPGQGKWTRTFSVVGFGALVAFGLSWLYNELSTVRGDYRIYVQLGVVSALALGFIALFWWVFNRPQVVDFMIATEAEMRKVNWPTRREITGSTWVVILCTLALAVILEVINVGLVAFFKAIHILEG